MEALTVEHFDVNEDDVKLCACGCGQPLKDGAKRSYIHGHKLAMEEGSITPDPEPSGEAVEKAIRITAKVKRDVEKNVGLYLSMMAGVWEMSDPFCGPVASAQAGEIAEKLTPILLRSPAAVRFFSSAGAFSEGLELCMALWPVIKIAGQHHLFRTVGQNPQQEGPQFPINSFVAP